MFPLKYLETTKNYTKKIGLLTFDSRGESIGWVVPATTSGPGLGQDKDQTKDGSSRSIFELLSKVLRSVRILNLWRGSRVEGLRTS